METYLIRTFGCQMNKHDSERVAGLLSQAGLRCVEEPADADVVVFMTCCVREKADERLHGQVASLKALKGAEGRGPLIAVGGCIGQRDAGALLERLSHVDVVFGTHNVSRLPALLAAASMRAGTQVEVLEEGAGFTSDLPTKREHPWHAWVPITVGCDNYCTYCVVPYVRGRERSRPIEEIVDEVRGLHREGVLEVTLLGQNVNSYGRDLFGEPRFAEVLRLVAEVGIPRVRFATSHPKDLSEDTIGVMASQRAVMPYLHLPIQSGSDRILGAMNRGYGRREYLDLVRRLYEEMPHLALSTDIIVGFPGETEDDFGDTLRAVEESRFDQAFTFIYSPRDGTPAASLPGRPSRDVVQDRFDRLVEVVHESAFRKNTSLVGTVQPVLFTGTSRRNDEMLSGRTPGNKIVHVPVSAGVHAEDPTGRIIEVRILTAHTWFLEGSIVGRNT